MRLGKPAVVVLAMSVLWMLLCIVYVQVTIGWADIFTLLPHELGSVFTGIFAPLVFLWLIMAYVGRGLVIRDTAKNLENELAKLTYPADDAEERVHAIAEALRHQAQELSTVSERAVSQAQYLHDGLHRQTEQLDAVSIRLSERALAVHESVEAQVKRLEAVSNDVLGKLEDTGAAFENSLKEMGPSAEAAADRVQAATDAIHNYADSAL